VTRALLRWQAGYVLTNMLQHAEGMEKTHSSGKRKELPTSVQKGDHESKKECFVLH
jgi:hypothetical protein